MYATSYLLLSVLLINSYQLTVVKTTKILQLTTFS